MSYLGEDGLATLWKTIESLFQIAKRSGYDLDLHPGNFMLGSDGHIVISDPFYAW
jgi:predicted unusual protein kinase regulating ubiquinone biosynthesis (AarF/ABC1/UbiB family)